MELLADAERTFDGTPRSGAAARRRTWTGRVLSGLAVLFLALDAAGKVLEVPAVLEGSERLGYPARTVFAIGAVLLASVIVHLVPRTAVVGAVLLTGYLGGAVAAHVRVGSPLLSHTLFPVYVAVLIWGGLHLRDGRLAAVVPWRARAARAP